MNIHLKFITLKNTDKERKEMDQYSQRVLFVVVEMDFVSAFTSHTYDGYHQFNMDKFFVMFSCK